MSYMFISLFGTPQPMGAKTTLVGGHFTSPHLIVFSYRQKIFEKYIFVSKKYLVCKLFIFERKHMYICIMDLVICYLFETHFAEDLIMNGLFARF